MASPYFGISIKDSGPVVVQSQPTTDRLLIIGPALDGPLNQVVQVSSLNEAINTFGPLTFTGNYVNPNSNLADNTYSYNELVRSYAEVLKTGANNIYLCRTGGQRAQAIVGGASGIVVTAENPGFLYNSVTGVMASNGTTGSLSIYQPFSLGGRVTVNYGNDVTLGQLIQNVNSSNDISLVRLYPNTSMNVNALAVSISGSFVLVGGTNGTEAPADDNFNGKFAMYKSLSDPDSGTFDAIEDFETDIVLLAGIYADDQVVTGNVGTISTGSIGDGYFNGTPQDKVITIGASSPTDNIGFALTGPPAVITSIITPFATYCAKESRERLTHGIIGLRPLGLDRNDPYRITAAVKNNWMDPNPGYVDASKHWIKFGYFRASGVLAYDISNGSKSDYGANVTVVAGPDVRLTIPQIGSYQNSPVNLYAGLVTTLPSERATTKSTLPGTLGAQFTFRDKQARSIANGIGFNELTGLGGSGAMVVLRNNFDDNSLEVLTDPTFANDRTPAFADLQPQRIVAEALRRIQNELKPYIGGPFNPQVHMSMTQRVKAVLDAMTEAGKLSQGGEGIGYNFAVNTSNPYSGVNSEVLIELTLWPAQQIKKISISTTIRRS